MKRSGWLAATLLPVLAVAGLVWLGLDRLEDLNRSRVDQSLTAALDSAAETLDQWARERQEKALFLSRTSGLLALVQAQLSLSPGPETLSQSRFLTGLRSLLEPRLAEHGFLSFDLIGPDGLTRASLGDQNLGREHLLAKDGSTLDLVFQGRTGLVASFPGEKESSGDPARTGSGKPTIFVLAPVKDRIGPVLAVLALGLDPGQAFSRIALSGRFGRTGETNVFDRSGRIISPSRPAGGLPEAEPGLILIHRLQEPEPGSTESRSLPGPRAGKDLDGYPDRRGVREVGSWRWVEGMGLGLAAEMDFQEAYAAYHTARWVVLLLLGGVVAVFGIVSALILHFRRPSPLPPQQALSANKELAGTVFETTHDGIIVTDPDGKIMTVNPAFSMITGYRPQEAIGRTFHLLSGERSEPEFLAQVWSGLREKGQWQGEALNRRKNGQAYPEWHTINVVRNEKGELVHLVSLFSDITQIKLSQEEIWRQAYHDTLTGLPNRLLFNDRLEMSLRQARRRSEMLAIIFLDLDRFKEINDSLGHDFGDLLLKEVALRLRESLREEDTVARLGGDEFLILLRNVKAAGDAEEVAAKITTSLSEVFLINDRRLKVTSSLGLAFHPDHGDGAEELIKNADVAMYQAKNMGRNNYQVFSPDLDDRTSKQLIIKTNLQRALDQGEFEIHYQPLVALKDGSVAGVEALLRWPGGDRHRIETAEFIQVAEETGLILPLSEWAFERMISQVKDWEHRGLKGIFLSVNLSLSQLTDRDHLVGVAKRVLDGSGLDPGRIRLEVSEKIYTSRFGQIKPVLEELKTLGVRLCLDHFGAGSSALSHLNKASLSALKMDKSITRDLGRSPESLELVKAIIAMSHSLGLEVVAEGVESRSQLQALAQIQCDQAQGFLISPPLPPEEVEVFIGRLSF